MKTIFTILLLSIISHVIYSQNSVIDSLNNKIKEETDNKKIVYYYNKIGDTLSYNNPDSSKYYYEKAYNISKLIKNDSLIGVSLMNIGGVYEKTGRLNTAKNYYYKALVFFKKTNNKMSISPCYNAIGNIFYYKGYYKKALENYQKSLKIYESLNDKFQISCEYHNIGLVHDDMHNYNRALKYYKKALVEFKKRNDLNWLSTCYNSIGCTYLELNNYKKGEENLKKALIYYKKLGDKLGVSIEYENIGSTKTEEGLYKDALIYLKKSLKLATEIEDYTGLASVNNSISKLYLKKKNFDKAINYAQKSIFFAKKNEELMFQRKSYLIIKKSLAAKGDYKKAYLYADSIIVIKDSISNHEKAKAVEEMESKYQSEKKQLQIENLEKSDALKKAEIKKQRYIKNGLILGSIFILIFAFLTYNRFLIKKRSNKLLTEQKNEILEKNEELQQQQEEILTQRDTIEEKNKYLEKAFNIIKQKNKNITDSINYAQRIQSAILPPQHYIDKILNDYFILFKPKDIVSGDFYWLKQNGNKIIIAAADCTGHGVPGAFMSILGTTFLNDINLANPNISANTILNILNENLKETLHQTEDKYKSRDGMDIALYIIDNDKRTLQFAGAHNPLYLIRNKKLYRYKADKMPIGFSRIEKKSFSNNEIKIEKGDSIYVFSDGYIDQFGKLNKEKFKTKRFQELLIRINDIPMNKQKNILNNVIETWRGEVEQIDDMLIIGVKI